MASILVLSKRQYMNQDLLDDRFGRFRELPLELARRGHRVRGLCLSYRRRPQGTVRDGPILWESVNATSLGIAGWLQFIRRATALAGEVDCIWACSDSIYAIIGDFAGRRHRVPLIADLYDNFEYYLAARLPLIKGLYRRAVRRASAVTCVSRPLAELIRSYGRSEGIFVLENAVREDLFRPMPKRQCRDRLGLPPSVRIVGTAGALHRSRGIDTLFDAFALLAPKYPDLHLALAGPVGPGVQIPPVPRVHYVGQLKLDLVPFFFNALDVAVVCNRDNLFGRYCFPQKAVEIMACRVPIVAAGVGSMRERFAGEPGWLFDPLDPGDLARVLERRFGDLRTDYGEVASWAMAGDLLEAVMMNAIAAGHGSPVEGLHGGAPPPSGNPWTEAG